MEGVFVGEPLVVFCAEVVDLEIAAGIAAAADGGEGEDIPDARGDQEDGDEVDLAMGIGLAVGADEFDAEGGGAFARTGGGLDLDFEDVAGAVLDGDIVGGGVAVGIEDLEAGGGSDGAEEKLRHFALALEVVAALLGHGVLDSGVVSGRKKGREAGKPRHGPKEIARTLPSIFRISCQEGWIILFLWTFFFLE